MLAVSAHSHRRFGNVPGTASFAAAHFDDCLTEAWATGYCGSL